MRPAGDWAYREFYRWPSIVRGSRGHGSIKHQVSPIAEEEGEAAAAAVETAAAPAPLLSIARRLPTARGSR